MSADPKSQEYSWTAQPARNNRRKLIFAITTILVLSVLIFFSFGSWSWAIFCLLFMVLTLNRFFFKSTFKIDAKGIQAIYPLKKKYLEWADIRRFQHDRYGGYLSTRRRPSRLDYYRGMHLYFAVEKDAAIKVIEDRISTTEK